MTHKKFSDRYGFTVPQRYVVAAPWSNISIGITHPSITAQRQKRCDFCDKRESCASLVLRERREPPVGMRGATLTVSLATRIACFDCRLFAEVWISGGYTRVKDKGPFRALDPRDAK